MTQLPPLEQTHVYREIFETPAAIRQTIEQTGPQAEHAAELIRRQNPRRIFLIGNGTSYYSSLAASYTARALAGPGDPQTYAVMSGDFRYYTPALDGSEVIIGMSASGEFRDVLAVFERLKGRGLLIGVTQLPGSSLTRLADFCLLAGGGPSQSPVMTKTYASTLTAAHLLLLAAYQAPAAMLSDLAEAAGRCEQALQAAENVLPGLVPELASYEHAFHFGGGPAYAAALETALKMKEMALLHAEASETWEMGSGPATMINAGCLAIALRSGDAADAHTAETARHALGWGARVLEIGPAPAATGSTTIPEDHLYAKIEAPAAHFPAFASLHLVPPAALLALRLAHQRGANPDTPGWRARYHAQGLTHIAGAPPEA